MLEAILGFFKELFVFTGLVGRSTMPKALDPEREAELVRLLAGGDREAHDELIERNLRLVAHIAKKYAAHGRDRDDLIQIGSIGLIKAVNTYTPSRGKSLSAYAGRCIENEILMSIRAERKRRGEVSLEEPIGVDRDGNEITVGDTLGTDEDSVFSEALERIDSVRLRETVESTLSGRELSVIVLRFGLDGGEPLPQREVGRMLGISRSYVSRIEKKAIAALKDAMAGEWPES